MQPHANGRNWRSAACGGRLATISRGLRNLTRLKAHRGTFYSPWRRLSMAAVAAAVPIWPPAVFLLLAGAIGSLIVRASVARPLRVVTGAFRQLNPLIAAADTLSSLDSDPATGPRSARCARTHAGWHAFERLRVGPAAILRQPSAETWSGCSSNI